MVARSFNPETDTASPPAHFLQTPLWAAFKEQYGWKPLFLMVDDAFVSILVRKIPYLGSIAYVPMGPARWPDSAVEQASMLATMGKAVKPFLPADTLVLRCDPPLEKSAGKLPGIKKPVMDIQPPDTVLLDIACTEEDLLAGMKPKWRYNIRLPGKKGVTVSAYRGREALETAFPLFWELYRETAQRDGITIHSENYYRDLLRTALEYPADGAITVYVARHESDALAAIIVMQCGTEATYLYGASSGKKRNLMPAYALQWQAICDAKKAGCLTYDFYGIPPSDDPSHPMHGLYRFKTGFGGRIIHRTGSLDVPLRPFRYGLFSVLERLRHLWYKKIRKLFSRGIPGNS